MVLATIAAAETGAEMAVIAMTDLAMASER